MIKTSKEIAVIALMVALLIAGQFVLSGVQGVEVVTVLFFSFCYVFGVKRGIAVAAAYSLLRNIYFGFFPQVILLYLAYYPLFAVVAGLTGRWLKKSGMHVALKIVICAAVAAVCTALFTLLDDVITPLYFGYSAASREAYFYASLPVMLTQVICAAATVAVLFFPLTKIFSVVKL
ncbi:MAG: hypothetical protein DBX59_02205 [Bacillota bacterium]|nr:MAG: hypothetical protein DBX59_02205 [Bacillota bacterium]